MDYVVPVGLLIILLFIGSLIIVMFPLNIYAISLGMIIIAGGIITLLLRFHFPPYRKEVELRLVEEAEKRIKKPIQRKTKRRK